MELATAPVRPGFVLGWIAAVTGSVFLLLPLICPRTAAEEASGPARTAPAGTDSSATAPTAITATPAPGGLTPVSNPLASDPLHGSVQAGVDAEEADPAAPLGPEVATPLLQDPTSGNRRAPVFQSLALESGPFFLPNGLPVFGPLVAEWSASSLAGDEEEDEPAFRLQVLRGPRGLFLLRLLLARRYLEGLELPQELLEALPEGTLARVRDAVARHRGRRAENAGSQPTWGEQARAAWSHLPEANRATIRERAQAFLLLLDEHQLAQLRERLRWLVTARAL